MSERKYEIIPHESFKQVEELTTCMAELLRIHEKFKLLGIDLDEFINVEKLELQIDKKISSII
jgi:hypothetical protein